MFSPVPRPPLFSPYRMKAGFVRKAQKALASGRAPLYLRLTYSPGPGPGAVVFVATGVYLLAREWDQKTQAVKGREPEHDTARATLRVWLGDAENVYQQHRKSPGLTVQKLKALLLGQEARPRPLLAVADALYQNKARPEMRKAFATLRLYRTRRLALEAYLSQLNAVELPAGAVDKAWLRRFERWCVGPQGYALATVRKYVGFVQELLDFAAEEGWVPSNPVEKYRYEVKGAASDPAYLPEAEVQALAKAALPRMLDRARVAWLFCCYTGLSYVDYFRFTPADVHSDGQGHRWIRMERQKTGTKVSIPVLAELSALLASCQGEVPKLERTYFNRRLKELSLAAGLSLPLTTGLARHTASHRLRNELGFTADEAAGILGHSRQVQHSHYSRMREEGLALGLERRGQTERVSVRTQLEAALAATDSPQLRAKLRAVLEELPD